MPDPDLDAATDRLNAGAEIPPIPPALIESMWRALSSIPKELLQQHAAGGHAVFAQADLGSLPQDPDQRLAMMTRYALFNALLERGLLADYMNDDSSREKVFSTAASFPCTKDDLIDAVSHRLVRDAPHEETQKMEEEFKQAGYDPDNPRVLGKFIAWMRKHC